MRFIKFAGTIALIMALGCGSTSDPGVSHSTATLSVTGGDTEVPVEVESVNLSPDPSPVTSDPPTVTPDPSTITTDVPTNAIPIAQKDSSPEQKSTASDLDPAILCVLIEEEAQIKCESMNVEEGSQYRWTSTATDQDMGGNKWQFTINQEPIGDKEQVFLEICQGSNCQTLETSVDTSAISSDSNEIENPTESKTDLEGSYEEHSDKDNKLDNMTMQSEYSRGKCDPDGTQYLDSPPMNADEITFMKPMGVMQGDHITPIDHMYVNYEPGSSPDVLAMADGHIVHIGHTGVDHRVIIEYSCDLYSIYIHIHELDPDIASQLDWVGSDEESKGRSYTRVPVRSGMIIGSQTGDHSFDLSVVDTRVILSGFVDLRSYREEFWKSHCVDPYDYWQGSFKKQLLEKTIVVNDNPPGGKIDYDVDGRLIGNWFEEGTGGYSGGVRTESDRHGISGHLAIAPSALVEDKLIISFGNFQNEGSRIFFANDDAPDPANVGPSSGIVMYELWDVNRGPDRDGICCDEGLEVVGTGERWYGDTYPEGGLTPIFYDHISSVVLLEMLDERTIKLETFNLWDEKLKKMKTAEEITQFTDKFRIFNR